MDDKLESVLNTVRSLTCENEGVIIDPVGWDEGVLRVRYYEGTNEDCPECVLLPDSFRDMVERMCQTQAPYVVAVKVIPASPPY